MELRGYLSASAPLPPLSAVAERELLALAKTGDEAAFEHLVRANLRFVVHVAKKYEGRGVDMDDLVAEGSIGLLDAIQKFDLTKQVKFVSYAGWWVRQKMLVALARRGDAMMVPVGRASDVYRVHKAQSVLRRAQPSEPTLAQMVAATGLTPSVVEAIIAARNGPVVSLDGDAEDGRYDRSPRRAEERIDSSLVLTDGIEQRELTHALDALLATLPPRQELILRFYYGMDGRFAFTLEQIAHALGITRERVRQLRDRRLEVLRESGAALGAR